MQMAARNGTHARSKGSKALTTEDILLAAPLAPLDSWNKNRTMFFFCSPYQEADMLKTFVEEAAALASITLFVGMIAVWAQLIPQF
jgi:hypothetical protein